MKTPITHLIKCFYVHVCLIFCFNIGNASATWKPNYNTGVSGLMSNDSTALLENDSTTSGYHFYQRNLLGEQNLIYKTLGAVLNNREYENRTLSSGFEKFYPLLYIKKLPVRDSSSSYLKFLTGTKTEQVFCAGFNQRVFKRFMMEGNYRSIVSPGFFQNQSSKIQNYTAGLAYQSSKNNYQAAANYAYSKIQLGQNGGLVTDSSLNNIANNQGNGLPVNLADAKINMKRNFFGFDQSFSFNEKTTDTLNQHKSFLSLNNISHSAGYNRFNYIYSSATINSDFYSNSFLDTVSTYDSLFISRFFNTLNLSFNIGRNPVRSGIDLYYKNEIITYDFINNDNQYTLHHIGSRINYFSSSFNGKAFFEYCYNTNLKNAISFSTRLEKQFYSVINSVNVEFKVDDRYPSLIASSYSSNHFIWDNDFKNINNARLSTGFSFAKDILSMKFSAENLRNYIYYDIDGLPVQYSGDFKVFSAEMRVRYNFFRNWNFYSESVFQASDNINIYAVPDFTSYSSIYYERFLFKKALKASIGAGCLYFTPYFADEFLPATAQFKRQSIQETGNYPYVDFFVNMKIKSVKFFAKMEHLNMAPGTGNYFYLPHQPTPGRTFKMGIDWTFSEALMK